MESHLDFVKYLILFLWAYYADVACSKDYYITPSVDSLCPQHSFCLSLSQFAANSSSYFGHDRVNLSLFFLPGNHILDTEFTLAGGDILSMTKVVELNGTVHVKCVNGSGRFNIRETLSASIKALHFDGCGGNTVTRVDHFLLEDTIFQNMEGKFAVLVLNEVSAASIVRSTFHSNIITRKCEHHDISICLIQARADYVYLERNTSLTAGGTLHAVSSTVVIESSKFRNNTAEIGGAFVAHNSSLHIIRSFYKDNRATFGGVMVTSESTVIIDASIFSENSAEVIGGVIITCNDSFTIKTSTFIYNRASGFSGVMETFGESSLTIINSTFTRNGAKRGGGVMRTFDKTAFTIANSTFTNNKANSYSGVMATHNESSLTITTSTFTNNGANSVGGVMVAHGESSFTITNSTFANNSAKHDGGVMKTLGEPSLTITNSLFTNNSAKYGGVVITFDESSVTIVNSTFTDNRANAVGGVIVTHDEPSFTITNSIFTNNRAKYIGGVIAADHKSSFIITNSIFTKNKANSIGGVLLTYRESSFTITNSIFNNNRADNIGGVMATYSESSFIIINSTFNNNSAMNGGGVMRTLRKSSFIINNSSFTNNSAKHGGVMRTFHETSFIITDSTFTNNTAAQIGAVIWCEGSFSVNNSRFNFNAVDKSLGMMFMARCYAHFSNSTFNHNFGSLYVFDSYLTLSGYTKFENGGKSQVAENVITRSEGGAITIFQSIVTFMGKNSLLNNQAHHGGAISATDSTIILHGETIIANNFARNGSGGGISLRESILKIRGNCNISNNHALIGGGIHTTSSTIAVHHPGILQVINNTAVNGSGIYLEIYPKLYILVFKPIKVQFYSLKLIGNHGNYGGAMYVADDANSGACSPNNECFIQTLAIRHRFNVSNTVHILFSENTATEQGPNIFGGLLDRCIPSPLAEVYLGHKHLEIHYSGISYLRNISSITALDSVASLPVQVCFCSMLGLPDCSYQVPPVRVKKGETFTVSLVAVDQVNHTVDANIISSLSSFDGGFGEGQQTQTVQRNCTHLTFNVFSPHDSETIHLYADGPCANAQPSTSHVTVQFMECTCSVGFQPQSFETRCECSCDSELSPYITRCNSTTNTVLRMNTNSWITYINDTDQPGYVIYPNCPFDYCVPPTTYVSINFNLPQGADAQCAYNRTGVLCGSCQRNLSLSLGSSRCLPCYSYWLIIFAVILAGAMLAGILLVAVVLVLNMTVATGLINGLIFYANIVAASNVFFPSSEPSFPTVLVAWFNLDIGLDVCFFDGLDAYSKTWLQLAFPMYIIVLVAVVVRVSEHSPRFSRLLGKRNPAASIALLILLPYAKLLSVTISALSFATLHYPDGTTETVWLPDGSVKYFQGRHIPLALVAVLIDIVAVVYAILILFWQCLYRVPKWKIFNWTRNTKFNTFITAYHAPYDNKHRYWTGLLLLVRVVLYVTASLTLSANPQVLPLLTIILIGTLIFMKGNIGMKLDKESLRDIIDKVMYLNLLILAAFTLYDFKTGVVKQTAIIYTSTITTSILFLGAIVYHVTLLIKRDIKPAEKKNEYPLVPVQDQPCKAEPTSSVIELPKSDRQPTEENK